jgi:hypothetical protein
MLGMLHPTCISTKVLSISNDGAHLSHQQQLQFISPPLSNVSKRCPTKLFVIPGVGLWCDRKRCVSRAIAGIGAELMLVGRMMAISGPRSTAIRAHNAHEDDCHDTYVTLTIGISQSSSILLMISCPQINHTHPVLQSGLQMQSKYFSHL